MYKWRLFLRQHAKEDLLRRKVSKATVKEISNRVLMMLGYLNKRVPPSHQLQPSSSTELPSFQNYFGKPANYVYRKTIVKKKYDSHRLANEIRKAPNAYKRMKERN